MKRLKDNISSGYVEAANRLNSRSARRKIVAYVESYDDVFFWRTVLSRYEDDTRYFEVMLPSHKTLERGKKSVLMNIMHDKVGRDMIACVDADYDYLLNGSTGSSRQMLESPYVLHTYVYAIENYQCYAPSLHNVCVMSTLNDREIFDFEFFMEQYSEAVFPLFAWSVWHYRQGRHKDFSLSDFNRVIEIGGFSLADPSSCLARLRDKVGRKVHFLEKTNPGAKSSFLALKREIQELGVTPKTTYLYIQGHFLLERVVKPILSKVCGYLIREREQEIRRQAVHSTQMKDELACYDNSTQDLTQVLKRNTGYAASLPFHRLMRDTEKLLSLNAQAYSASAEARERTTRKSQET